jgi:hypothetical protein
MVILHFSSYLYIAEQYFGMIVDVVFFEKLGYRTQQVHFWHRKQISKLNHFSSISLRECGGRESPLRKGKNKFKS